MKIARVIAPVLNAEIKKPSEVDPEDLITYDLVGFGSGIYSSTFHKSLICFAEKLSKVSNKKAFLFSTCGASAFSVDQYLRIPQNSIQIWISFQFPSLVFYQFHLLQQ